MPDSTPPHSFEKQVQSTSCLDEDQQLKLKQQILELAIPFQQSAVNIFTQTDEGTLKSTTNKVCGNASS